MMSTSVANKDRYCCILYVNFPAIFGKEPKTRGNLAAVEIAATAYLLINIVLQDTWRMIALPAIGLEVVTMLDYNTATAVEPSLPGIKWSSNF